MVLLAISWLAAARPGVIVSSIIWIIIGFELYDLYPDDALLLLGIVYMIAFVQIFMPLNKVKG